MVIKRNSRHTETMLLLKTKLMQKTQSKKFKRKKMCSKHVCIYTYTWVCVCTSEQGKAETENEAGLFWEIGKAFLRPFQPLQHLLLTLEQYNLSTLQKLLTQDK